MAPILCLEVALSLMKRSLKDSLMRKVVQSSALSLVLLSACTTVPVKTVVPAPVQPVAPVVVEPDLVPDEVVKSDNAESIATDFGLIFIDRDMTFTGTLPCDKCPGVQYHINVYQDGKFEARREFIDRNVVELIKGSWMLDNRTLHFTSQRQPMPSFQFASNQHLTLLDIAGKPMVSADNKTLSRRDFSRIDSRLPLLGMYELKDNEASFTDCLTGESHLIAMTQHHMPMMRSYQTNPGINGKSVVATLTARKSPDNNDALFVDKFDQFWPGATCPSQAQPAKIQGVVWRLSTVSQIGVPQKLNIRMMFDQNKLFGFSGCNNFNAGYQQKDNQLNVAPVVSTRKFCSDANFYEQQFTKQLQLADRIEINQNKLQLFKANKVIIEMTQALN
ncbi:META domain-containing protein [Rheinheimera sp. SA_1]|jgi:heat shock protein HslJ|uniref:META domain-containing protein n=1 Tax=Rheinheimera sp. SA_1 TaxID=1827365 RepID=UPI000A82BB14|nr:META domain-containing protein [Rheinheimera sp. SA_1]